VTVKRRRTKVGHIPSRRRLGIYSIGIGVWLTGVLWLVFHYFIKTEDEFGIENSTPYEQVWLVGHAAFSFFAIWMFGVLWLSHIKLGWNAKMNRVTGGTLFAVIAILILTGFGLYYLGNANLRSWTSVIHWVVGLAALIFFVVHRFPRLSRFLDRDNASANQRLD
jgi:hypothetical protein